MKTATIEFVSFAAVLDMYMETLFDVLKKHNSKLKPHRMALNIHIMDYIKQGNNIESLNLDYALVSVQMVVDIIQTVVSEEIPISDEIMEEVCESFWTNEYAPAKDTQCDLTN